MNKKRATWCFLASTVWSALAVATMQYAPPWDAAVFFLIGAALSLVTGFLYLQRGSAR